jgi:hypothetical protein
VFPHWGVPTGGPPSCEASRETLEAVLEALDIPHAATVGDDEIRAKILEHRLGHTVVMLKSVLREEHPTPDIPWSVAYLRTRLAEHPAPGYKTWAARVAELEAKTVSAICEVKRAANSARTAQPRSRATWPRSSRHVSVPGETIEATA